MGQGILVGSPRVVALGGAYTAVAEGAAGFASNLAALAHRAPHLERRWDLGVAFSWTDIPLTDPQPRDLDNDGRRDQAQSSTQFLVGLLLQYQRFGVGTSLRSTHQSFCSSSSECAPQEQLHARLRHTALAGAMALGREELIIGAGLYVADATFEHRAEQWRYSGTGFQVDALYRPHGLPLRVGLSLKPEVTGAWDREPQQPALIAGRRVSSAIVSPGAVSFGIAFRFGEGAEHFNRLSPAARADLEQRFGADALPPPTPVDAPNGRWLLSLQADLIGRTEDAIAVTSLTAPQPQGAPEPVGRSALLAPRVGVEHETLPGRLRTRLGTFLEPSAFARALPRPHVTGGAELFLFHYFDAWAVSASFDVAKRYGYFGLSFGVWR